MLQVRLQNLKQLALRSFICKPRPPPVNTVFHQSNQSPPRSLLYRILFDGVQVYSSLQQQHYSTTTTTGIMNIKFIGGDAPRFKTSHLSAVIVGFCNGFVCLRDPRYSPLYHQSYLGGFRILPKHRQVISAATAAVREVFGFGFSHAQSHYKVLAITLLSLIPIILSGKQRLGFLYSEWRIMANNVPFTRYRSIQVNATLNGGALVHSLNS